MLPLDRKNTDHIISTIFYSLVVSLGDVLVIFLPDPLHCGHWNPKSLLRPHVSFHSSRSYREDLHEQDNLNLLLDDAVGQDGNQDHRTPSHQQVSCVSLRDDHETCPRAATGACLCSS